MSLEISGLQDHPPEACWLKHLYLPLPSLCRQERHLRCKQCLGLARQPWKMNHFGCSLTGVIIVLGKHKGGFRGKYMEAMNPER